MSKKEISRRKFMKSGLAFIAGTAASFGSVQRETAQKEIIGVSRTSLKPLMTIPTTCEQCPAGCGIIAYLDGERLVQLLGNPNHPNNRGGICAKGIAGINLVNDPERLLFPMRRTGSRGDGQWARITWDEAYSTLGSRIKKMIHSRRINELVIDKGHDDPLLDRFIDAVGASHIIDRPFLKNINRNVAFMSMIGSSSLNEDVERSRTILNFGANPYASHDQFIGIARRLVSARIEKGARLITFDIRMSETAAKSDAWFPIKAGTDSIVALAMANVIIEKGLADNAFMEHKTNLPLAKIKSHLSQYTPKAAEKKSGIKAEDIERIAVEFATQKPSVVIIGGGVSEHENGSQNVRCLALLNWLIGNLEKEGGLFLPRIAGNYPQKTSRLQNDQLYSGNFVNGIKELQEHNIQIDTYFSYLSNPAYEDPECNKIAQLLKDEKKVPFLVVLDTHLTETAMIADIVLPGATYLEGWGIRSVPSLDRVPILNLKQPVVSLLSPAKVLRSPVFDTGKLLEPQFLPRGESVEAGNFCLELARRIGGAVSKKLPYMDTQDYVTKIISSIPQLKEEGGFKVLKKLGLWIDKTVEKDVHKNRIEKKLRSKLQKVEIYSTALKQKGSSPLPEFKPITGHIEKKEGEFILTTFKSNLAARGTTNSKWTQEILHENRLWINKEEAAKLGIKNGSRVRVISSVGSLVIRVLTTNRIHPESVAIAEGLGHTAVGQVAQAKRFKSNDQDTNLIWWGKKGNGVNPNEIIERRKDPIGGGLGLKDTIVRIEKI